MSLLWILSMHIWHWWQNWRLWYQGHYFRSIRTLTEQPRETADVFSRRLLFRKTTINTRRCLVLFLSWNITWTLLVGLEHVHGNILPVNWPCLWIGQDIRCSVHWSSHGSSSAVFMSLIVNHWLCSSRYDVIPADFMSHKFLI